MMRWPRFRFTVRRMMLIVALMGLNFWAAARTAQYYPRPKIPFPHSIGSGRGMVSYGPDGSVSLYSGNAETGYHLESVEPGPPSTFQVWSPVIFSVGLTALVMTVAGLTARYRRLPLTPVPADHQQFREA